MKKPTPDEAWQLVSRALHQLARDFRKMVPGKASYDFAREIDRMSFQATKCAPSGQTIEVEEIDPSVLGWKPLGKQDMAPAGRNEARVRTSARAGKSCIGQ